MRCLLPQPGCLRGFIFPPRDRGNARFEKSWPVPAEVSVKKKPRGSVLSAAPSPLFHPSTFVRVLGEVNAPFRAFASLAHLLRGCSSSRSAPPRVHACDSLRDDARSEFAEPDLAAPCGVSIPASEEMQARKPRFVFYAALPLQAALFSSHLSPFLPPQSSYTVEV